MALEVGVAVDMSLPPLRNGDLYHFLSNRLMVGIDQLDEDLVRPRREAIDNDGLSAGICPDPRGIVDRHMDVSDTGRDGQRGRSKHRHDVQVLSAILNHYPTPRQGLWQRRIDDDLRGWFVLKRLDRRRSAHLSSGLCRA